MKLGFIGLGVMGRPMALNLIRGGRDMNVYARRAESAAPLVAAGARRFDSPAEVAAHSDVIFTMVTASSDVEAVVLGERGVRSGALAGAVLVEMETIDPEVARAVAVSLAEKNIEMLDAPVSGGPDGAQQATLSIMVGGKAGTFARVKLLSRTSWQNHRAHGEPWRGSDDQSLQSAGVACGRARRRRGARADAAKARTTCPR
jgi:3-hydroxyisobutyrate dehydrogenase-like beta-hydroxyacid dehydrogenase